MNPTALLLLSSLLLTLVSGQTTEKVPQFVKKGRCSLTSKPVLPFDKNLFSGRWYRVGGIKNPEENSSVNCTTFDYSATNTGMSVIVQGVGAKNEPTYLTEVLTMQKVNEGSFQFMAQNRSLTMDIISTDYHSYACFVACENIFDTHYVLFGSILNRAPDFDKTVIASCQRDMDKVGVPIADLRGIPQGPQCTYPA